MRAKLLLLMCLASWPSLLPAQLDEIIAISALVNYEDPQKRLASQIAPAGTKLAPKESTAGAQSPETADAVSALAELHFKAGNYERASPLIERALKLGLTTLGDGPLATQA